MPNALTAYRVVSSDTPDAWADSAAAADAIAAERLGIDPAAVAGLTKPVTVDPVVVRRDDGRWRSRRAWSARSNSIVVRVYEMLKVDEEAYDH